MFHTSTFIGLMLFRAIVAIYFYAAARSKKTNNRTSHEGQHLGFGKLQRNLGRILPTEVFN